MNNAFDTMRTALDQGREANRAADHFAGQMANMLKGRLRHVSRSTLSDLKRELSQFNAKTGEWKS